jgi:hypothetical protein
MHHATPTQARHAYWLNWICPPPYRPPVVGLSNINDREEERDREKGLGVGSTMEMVMSVRPVERVLNILRLCSRFARSFCAAESISNSLARSQQRRRIQHPMIKWGRRPSARVYSPAIQSLPVVIGHHVGPSGEGGRPPRTQQAFLQLAHVGEPSTHPPAESTERKAKKWVPTRRPPRSASSTCASTRVSVG